MLHKIRDTLLGEWVEEAQISNITYFRLRRELFQSLINKMESSRDSPDDECTSISPDDFFTIKQVLTSRNDSISNDARLAFDRLLTELS